MCTQITSLNPATYTVTFTVSSEACNRYPSGNASYEIAFVGFGRAMFELSFYCSCEPFCTPRVSY